MKTYISKDLREHAILGIRLQIQALQNKITELYCAPSRPSPTIKTRSIARVPLAKKKRSAASRG